MKNRLLVDGDHLLFKQCSAVEEEREFRPWRQNPVTGEYEPDPDAQSFHTIHTPFKKAYDSFMGSLKMYGEHFNTDDIVLVFSGKNNFRKDLWDGYKANRKATRKPLCYWGIIDKIRSEGPYKLVSEDCLEGDDYIGILATRPDLKASSINHVIISGDKDMNTLPDVKVFWIDESKSRDFSTTKESADAYWLKQTLTGDLTDGYKGCPGMGEVSAQAIVDKGITWEAVVEAYEKGVDKQLKNLQKKYPDADVAPCLLECGVNTAEELALLNARLARILRFEDWDSKSRSPILWTPGG